MSVPVFSQGFTLFCTLILGSFVLSKNPHNTINRTFFVVCLLLSAWNACGVVIDLQTASGVDPILTSRLSMSVISLFYLSFIYLTCFFPYTDATLRCERTLLIFQVLTLISIVLAFAGFYVKDFVVTGGSAEREFSVGIYYFIGLSLVSAFYGFRNLIWKFRRTNNPSSRKQIIYVLLGAMFGFMVALLFSLALPLAGINRFFYLGESAPLFFVVFSTYAIVKHRLLDIDIIIRKSIMFTALITLITLIYVTSAITIGQFFESITNSGTLIATLMSALVIVVGFRPLETFIENATDSVFFKGKYDYQKAIGKLSLSIGSVIDTNDLLKLVLVTISRTMRIERVSMDLADEDHRWQKITLTGGTGEGISFEDLEPDAAFLRFLEMSGSVVSCDELSHVLLSGEMESGRKTELARVRDILRDAGTSLCVPIFRGKELTGVLNLGRKISDDTYNTRDIELFWILGGQISVAVENARLYEKMERAKRLAAIGEFASSIVHEIRNPLLSIKTFFQVLNGNESENDKKTISGLAEQELIRVEEILENLLSFAKPREPEFSMADLVSLLDETLALVTPECATNGIRIEKDYDGNAPHIEIDRNLIKQVLLNLFFNSIQAMPKGGDLRVRLTHDESEGNVQVIVIDSGTGISQRNLARLFNPFFTTRPKGTGLGLSISRRIIEQHNGTIRVDSREGQGTRVTVALPLKAP